MTISVFFFYGCDLSLTVLLRSCSMFCGSVVWERNFVIFVIFSLLHAKTFSVFLMRPHVCCVVL